MHREYPRYPIAAVAAVVLEGESVLLVKRRNPPNPGTWGLPGGAVELGEEVTQAVSREVKEETALETKPIRFLTVFDSIHLDDYGRPQYHYVILEYLCKPVAGVISPGGDVLEARWIPLSQLSTADIAPRTARFIIETASRNRVSRDMQ